jgi:hypothetical protein
VKQVLSALLAVVVGTVVILFNRQCAAYTIAFRIKRGTCTTGRSKYGYCVLRSVLVE